MSRASVRQLFASGLLGRSQPSHGSTAEQHRREIIRFYLILRFLFLVVSLLILLIQPESLNPNPPKQFLTRLWSGWFVFLGWSTPLYLSYRERNLQLTDRLISISIIPDCFALYMAASVTSGTAGIVYRSVYFLIAIHSYHFTPKAGGETSLRPNNELKTLTRGALFTVTCGMTLYCALIRSAPWAHYVVESGLQLITAAAFLLVRLSDVRRAASSEADLEEAKASLQRQKEVESRLLEAMQDVSSLGRVSTVESLDKELRQLVRVIGQNLRSEYCVLSLVREDRLHVVARHASFPLTDSARAVLRKLESSGIGDGLMGGVLTQKRMFRWNSEDVTDLVDLSEPTLAALNISLDRDRAREFRDHVLPSAAIRNVLIAPFYSQDNVPRPLGYLLLVNDTRDVASGQPGFSFQDEERLGTVAAQLALAISNFERHREDIARAENEAFFNSLLLTPELDDLFDRVLNHLNREYSSRVASLWLATEDGFGARAETLRIVLRSAIVDQRANDSPKAELEGMLKRLNIFKPDQCYIGRFFSADEVPAVTYIEDTTTVTDSWAPCLEQIGTRHMIAIPIRRYHERRLSVREGAEPSPDVSSIAGVVCLRPRKPFVMTSERRESLERFADYLAVLMEGVRFRRRYRQIEILKNQLPALQSADLKEFYSRVVRLVRDAMSAEACSLFTLDSEGALILKATTADRAVRIAAKGRRHELITATLTGKIVYPANEPSITAKIADVRKTTLIYDVHRNSDMSKLFMEVTETAEHESLIGAPIVHTDGSLLGVLRCINRKKAGALLPVFVQGDQEFLDLIMGIMARFIENAEASESKRDFLRQLAHELSTPLAALLNQIEYLEEIVIRGRSVRSPEDQFGFLREQAKFVQYLVTDIQYQFGKGAAIVTRFDFASPVDLRSTIYRINKLLLATARMDKQVDIVTGISRMPPLYVDARRMEQVIFNLVQNAVKYSRTAAGDVFVGYDLVEEVDPHTQAVTAWHRLSVQDFGVGVRQSDLPSIFEEYRRGSNIEGSPSGTGLGLAVAKRIVEAHGGRISVTSLKAPTTFAVDLPEFLTRRPPQ